MKIQVEAILANWAFETDFGREIVPPDKMLGFLFSNMGEAKQAAEQQLESLKKTPYLGKWVSPPCPQPPDIEYWAYVTKKRNKTLIVFAAKRVSFQAELIARK